MRFGGRWGGGEFFSVVLCGLEEGKRGGGGWTCVLKGQPGLAVERSRVERGCNDCGSLTTLLVRCVDGTAFGVWGEPRRLDAGYGRGEGSLNEKSSGVQFLARLAQMT